VGPRRAWPLDMHLARALVADRFALVGDAAHSVHPIAGQGLNLALRDVAALAEVVADAARLGLDIGAATTLERYERWRRADSALSAATFDALNRLFSNTSTVPRTVRGIGLGMVERLPALKQAFVTEAAGLAGDVPKLLRGLSV
jgi:2-octaprenyl-6-methoxyphenol hydroxylase